MSPSLALRVLFMPVMTYPTCPVRSCCVAAGSGVSRPTWHTLAPVSILKFACSYMEGKASQ